MKSKTAIALILTLAAAVFAVRADESAAKQWWHQDDSTTEHQRLGDMRRAAKIETAGGVVRFFAEGNGKLVLFWEAKSQKTADTVRQQLQWAPSIYVPIGNDAFVNMEKVASIEISKDKEGQETAIMRGIGLDLATVRDAGAIKIIRAIITKR